MTRDTTNGGFRFEYEPGVIRHGIGAAGDLADELATDGLERALVVCGRTVGRTDAVIDPVVEGLGDRLAGVFDETTPDKRLGTAYDCLEAMADHDADALVALGGGSSLDVARIASVLTATDRDPHAVGAQLRERGTITVPDGALVPTVAVPTTLAGAALSAVAGVTADPETCPVDSACGGAVSDPRLMPRAVVTDPELVATTPWSVLAPSAMNGFDKGIETLYAANATPVTDATASRGLGLLAEGLRTAATRGTTAATLDPVVRGNLLVQYGISRPGETTLSIVHSFGHALTRENDLHQGRAHAVVVPHVLRYVFDTVDGRRDLLADALGVTDGEDPAAGVVDAVTAVRDALNLPTRLRDVDGPDPEEFDAVAEDVLADPFMDQAPPGLDPDTDDIRAILDRAH